jgi:hypothetical protein
MFGQIKMEIPWYINWHTLISRKRDGKPRMIGGQFVVVHHYDNSVFMASVGVIEKALSILCVQSSC